MSSRVHSLSPAPHVREVFPTPGVFRTPVLREQVESVVRVLRGGVYCSSGDPPRTREDVRTWSPTRTSLFPGFPLTCLESARPLRPDRERTGWTGVSRPGDSESKGYVPTPTQLGRRRGGEEVGNSPTKDREVEGRGRNPPTEGEGRVRR